LCNYPSCTAKYFDNLANEESIKLLFFVKRNIYYVAFATLRKTLL